MIEIRRAHAGDLPGIAAAHVATWRSTYAGVLPDEFLARLSAPQLLRQYDYAIRMGVGVFVAVDANPLTEPGVLGFATARRSRNPSLAEGEVETLYVLDDWQNQGLGGRLLRAAGKHLAGQGCRSAYAWVLRENPAVYFYRRLGGKCVANGTVFIRGKDIPQTAYAWDPIETLLDVDA